ncbi:Golgi transport complex subunit 1 [Homalodisca vitripennis]|nr:Golgi transport complex subunit 1 [Homalodisca vitripennis]
MPVPGLLTIDPDKLFVQYSILEIEDVQRKLQNEIERKREELRTMVGTAQRAGIVDRINVLVSIISVKLPEILSKTEFSKNQVKVERLVDNVIAESRRPFSWCIALLYFRVLPLHFSKHKNSTKTNITKLNFLLKKHSKLCLRPSARASAAPSVLPRADVDERKTSLEIVPISKISNSRGANQKYKLNCNGKAMMYRANHVMPRGLPLQRAKYWRMSAEQLLYRAIHPSPAIVCSVDSEPNLQRAERYRDLIEAADTISQMKVLSEKVIDDVNSMKISTAELQERQVSGFKIEHYTREVKDNTWACVAFQIKVLVDISEYIWESIDQADFTRATLLFLMARYIKTSLEINPSFKTSEYFPVVSRQWSSVVHFKETILKGAEDTLKSQNLSQVTSSSLVSLALLESLTAEQLLQRYISLRSDALRAVLSSHQTLDSDAIKQRLCHSYTLLIHSITAISDCFVGGAETKNGLLWEDLARHVGPQSPPTLHLLEKENEDMPTSFLPSAIKQFRPVLDWSLEPLPESQVHKAITTWLVWVRSFVKEQGGHLLQRLSSLRSLQGLRDPPAVSSPALSVDTSHCLQIYNSKKIY